MKNTIALEIIDGVFCGLGFKDEFRVCPFIAQQSFKKLVLSNWRKNHARRNDSIAISLAKLIGSTTRISQFSICLSLSLLNRVLLETQEAFGFLTRPISYPYPIVIERFNTIGETVSQSFTLTVAQPSANTFNSWIATFPSVGGDTSLTDDFDRDGLPNGIENFLGTSPASSNAGLIQVSSSPTTLVFRHSRSNLVASDITPSYEWSADLARWNGSAVTTGGTTVTIGTSIIMDTQAPTNDLVEVTATISGNPSQRIFVRLKTVR